MKGQEVYLILHNIRSAYNVGSIFRTADAAGVKKIYICGYTPCPFLCPVFTKVSAGKQGFGGQNKISKTALGAEKTVPWQKFAQTWRLLKKLKKEGVQIVALEQSPGAIDYRKFKPLWPVALVLGNEVVGLSEKILNHADKIIAIPMSGKKESLNVAIAVGIALYKIIE